VVRTCPLSCVLVQGLADNCGFMEYQWPQKKRSYDLVDEAGLHTKNGKQPALDGFSEYSVLPGLLTKSTIRANIG
jgi:hypothetical protein